MIGEKGRNLVCEGNYYYDVAKTGCGFHGDSERRRVIGLRLGASIPLHYNWFHNAAPIGYRFKETFSHGDLYVMSSKTVGWDWKFKNQITLRHAAGSNKFL